MAERRNSRSAIVMSGSERADACQVIDRGQEKTRGSYKKLVRLFNMPASDYLKFLDFLRHQRLKPAAHPRHRR
jgi:hypothetical protein